MKKRILSLVLCAAMLLSMCLFLGAGVTDGTYKVTVNYIYESDSSPVAQATVLQVAKDDPLTKEIVIPTQENYKPKLAEGMPSGITLDVDRGILKFENFMPTGNVTVKVFYVASDAKYKVNHYLQNLTDDEYTLKETVEMTGSIDAYTKAVANKYEGFTASEITQTPIAADDTTVVDIKYTRNYYMVQFDANGGVNGPEPIYAKYGTEYTIPNGENAPTKQGYRFNGWWSDGTLLTEGKVEGNVTYTADWKPVSNKASVTVVYWGQNANDDEYSYYGAVELQNQTVDQKINWDTVAYICGKTEHTHSAACGLNCKHVHNAACLGGKSKQQPVDGHTNSARENIAQFQSLSGGKLQSGYVYRVKCDGAATTSAYDKYYLYFDGEWYLADSSACDGAAVKQSNKVNAHDHSWNLDNNKDQFWMYKAKCSHQHDDSCYACGLVAHTHSDSCKAELSKKMDSSLWEYEKSDTVTVDAAGNTIMNVYYTRKEFTLHFRASGSDKDNYGTIKARWGKNISVAYQEKVNAAGSSFWSETKDVGPYDTVITYTNYIGVMPKKDVIYYNYRQEGDNESKMTYYGEDLNGVDKEIFSITFKRGKKDFKVSKEDHYEFEGFTYDHGTPNDAPCNGAEFHYKRNAYTLSFYSASNSKADKTESVKYEAPLGNYDYRPKNKPAGVEPDAVFAGWYLNPQCTGEQYDLSKHKMPANDIALYAKWVNCNYTVTTYTDESLGTLYKYDGYDGWQSVVKYAKGNAPTNPTKDGYVFVGWFYKDNGTEKPFSFEMGITKDYDLYPKWSNEVNVNYTIRYVDSKTGNPITGDDTGSARIGSSVTVKSKPIDGYFPEKTSTSVQINQDGQVITLYYVPAKSQKYTVRYVEVINEEPHNIVEPETKTTSDQQVVVPAMDIEGFTPDQYKKTLELTAGGENVVTFYYTKQVTINYVPLEGGEVDPGTQTLIRTTGKAQGSTPTPNSGYKFVGWYTDKACTQPVDKAWVNADTNKLTPQQENGVYKDATYYAKFELDVFDLTIKKAAANGSEIDPNQIFVFHVVSADHETDMEVTVQGIGSVTIKGLPLGTTYTVTEETDWTWQYKPDEKTKNVVINGTTAEVTFTNTYSKSNWLTSFAEVINKWINGQIRQTEIKN